MYMVNTRDTGKQTGKHVEKKGVERERERGGGVTGREREREGGGRR